MNIKKHVFFNGQVYDYMLLISVFGFLPWISLYLLKIIHIFSQFSEVYWSSWYWRWTEWGGWPSSDTCNGLHGQCPEWPVQASTLSSYVLIRPCFDMNMSLLYSFHFNFILSETEINSIYLDSISYDTEYTGDVLNYVSGFIHRKLSKKEQCVYCSQYLNLNHGRKSSDLSNKLIEEI